MLAVQSTIREGPPASPESTSNESGFGADVNERLRRHKTSAPFARIIKAWPCRGLWEKTAIDCVSEGCERLHTEVFRTQDIGEVLKKADSFFGLMPDPSDSEP